ncbi:hypothetical protein M438DRAFT_345392 [Aureobasidium pullulans EXF-150]|uniref:Uncharacterized protein n=1 Tax=Aureobasidium pullulans EXF-150 TaxID=1043002 RepID=A0A074XFR6_AURPU|nr:uncharacterized protein M438DRAFT_345392 [Aureobasidium pullulans EXF-150]KEQ84238.1 hypothetical protein M438DRAFT_345392 [Aureobasidium pullulans EXF-150]
MMEQARDARHSKRNTTLLCLFLSNLVATRPPHDVLVSIINRAEKKHDSFVQADVSRSHRRDLFDLLIAMCWLGQVFFPK